MALRCPVGTIGSQESLQSKMWYTGRHPAVHKSVAKLIMQKHNVIYNKTFGARSGDMGFISVDGDLSIRNLRFADAGFYTCHFTGFEYKVIELSVKGMFHPSQIN